VTVVGPPPSVGSLGVLRRLVAAPREREVAERCELCGQPIPAEHGHLVNVELRSLLCACRPCYLLFTDADLKYRAVPDRHLQFINFRLIRGQWDDLEIPVNLAFFFSHSGMDRTVAFYPGPAGATESELDLAAWESVVSMNPGLRTLAPDVEAVLIRLDERGSGAFSCFLVPIDACYELVGQLRQVWRGFDGGQEARSRIDGFFADLGTRSRQVDAADELPR
jgi:Family of unknown function (DUF5947)